VDLVIELPDGRPIAVEVKAATTPSWGDVAGLRAFMSEYPESPGGLVLHGGSEVYQITERIIAAPWSVL
jgi:hypothetical protein